MRNRHEAFHLRLMDVELRALELMAEFEYRKPSEMLRELIREGAAQRGFWPPLDGDEDYAEIERSLNT